MARHEVKIHANGSRTAESAPFLGSYITKSTVGLDAVSAMAAELVGMPTLKYKNTLQNAIETFLDWEREGACRIYVDGGYIEIKLLGSFPASDSPWDPAKNKFVVVFVPDAATRDHLINETPVIVTDETSTKVRVDNVFDADPARAKPTEIVYGQAPFVSQGFNQVMSDPGAKAEMVDARGVRFDCVVLEEINRQNVKLKTAELLESGDYKFMLTSRGGDAEGDPQTVMKKVKYIRVTPPVVKVTKVYMAGHPEKEGVVDPDGANVFEGENLVFGEGDSLTYHEIDAPDTEIACDITASSSGKLEFNMNGNAPSNAPIFFTLKTRGGIPGGQLQTVEVEAVSRDYEE